MSVCVGSICLPPHAPPQRLDSAGRGANTPIVLPRRKEGVYGRPSDRESGWRRVPAATIGVMRVGWTVLVACKRVLAALGTAGWCAANAEESLVGERDGWAFFFGLVGMRWAVEYSESREVAVLGRHHN